MEFASRCFYLLVATAVLVERSCSTSDPTSFREPDHQLNDDKNSFDINLANIPLGTPDPVTQWSHCGFSTHHAPYGESIDWAHHKLGSPKGMKAHNSFLRFTSPCSPIPRKINKRSAYLSKTFFWFSLCGIRCWLCKITEAEVGSSEASEQTLSTFNVVRSNESDSYNVSRSSRCHFNQLPRRVIHSALLAFLPFPYALNRRMTNLRHLQWLVGVICYARVRFRPRDFFSPRDTVCHLPCTSAYKIFALNSTLRLLIRKDTRLWDIRNPTLAYWRNLLTYKSVNKKFASKLATKPVQPIRCSRCLASLSTRNAKCMGKVAVKYVGSVHFLCQFLAFSYALAALFPL